MCKNMSNKKTKQAQAIVESDSEEEQESDRDSDLDSDGNYIGDNQLEAMFEGRNPEDCDYHGIKQLLRQLFLKANVDLGDLTQIIIAQNYVGSVVKQSWGEGDQEEEEDDDDDDGMGGVFGITTVINVTKRKNEECIQQLRTLLITLAEENATTDTTTLIKEILNDDAHNVGFIINERIINIPAAISVPLFDSLQGEIEKAIRKNMPYNFKYLVWICKTYIDKSNEKAPETIYTNSEEEQLASEALASFDVDVSDQVDSSQWETEGVAMTPTRKLLILEARKLNHLVKLIENHVNELKAAATK